MTEMKTCLCLLQVTTEVSDLLLTVTGDDGNEDLPLIVTGDDGNEDLPLSVAGDDGSERPASDCDSHYPGRNSYPLLLFS